MPPEGRLQMTRRSRLRPCSSLGPRAQRDPAAGPGATARGEEAAGAAPPSGCCWSLPGGPGHRAGPRAWRGSEAGPAPLRRPCPRAPLARGQPGSSGRGPALARPADAWVLESSVSGRGRLAASAPHLQPRLFHPELRVEPGGRLRLPARVRRPLGASGPRDAAASPGRAGRRACEPGPRARLPGLAGSICSLPAGRGPAPDRPLLDPRREGWSRSGAWSGRKSSPGSGSSAGLAGTKREPGWEALAGSLKNTPLSQGTHFSLGTAKLSHMKC